MIEKPIICIASGPSLTPEDVAFCEGRGHVYVVKECHHLAPWADGMYAADDDWWDKFNGVPEFKGAKYTCNADSAKKYGLIHVEGKSNWKWSLEQGKIALGGNSGFQALNVATLNHPNAPFAALLGYDFGFKYGTNKHWWEQKHPRHSRPSNYESWIKRFAEAKPYIPMPVYNCTVQTALNCFERRALREVIHA